MFRWLFLSLIQGARKVWITRGLVRCLRPDVWLRGFWLPQHSTIISFWICFWQYREFKRKITKEQIDIAQKEGRKAMFDLVKKELETVSIMLSTFLLF